MAVIRVYYNLVITTCKVNLAEKFFRSESIQGIIYTSDMISVNYGIAVETSVVYANSQFPSFLAD